MFKSKVFRHRQDVKRKRRLYEKAQKAGCVDAVPTILGEIYGWNRRLGMIAHLRSERRA